MNRTVTGRVPAPWPARFVTVGGGLGTLVTRLTGLRSFAMNGTIMRGVNSAIGRTITAVGLLACSYALADQKEAAVFDSKTDRSSLHDDPAPDRDDD